MKIGSLYLKLCCYLKPVTALARHVAIGKHAVFFFSELQKGIRKSYDAIELCPASCGRRETLELPNGDF